MGGFAEPGVPLSEPQIRVPRLATRQHPGRNRSAHHLRRTGFPERHVLRGFPQRDATRGRTQAVRRCVPAAGPIRSVPIHSVRFRYRRWVCDGCRRDRAIEAGKAARPAAAAVLSELRDNGRDPAHGGDAAKRRGKKTAGHQHALREWESRVNYAPDPERFSTDIRPAIERLSSQELAIATGLSEHYCSLIRLGKRTPHPRHWETLRLVGQAHGHDARRCRDTYRDPA